MVKKATSHEKISSQKENNSKLQGWIKTTATATLLALTACNDIPNNEIRLNPENQQVEFSIEHTHYEGNSSTRTVDYDITVNREGDTYMGLINKKDGRKGTNIQLQSNDLNDMFNQIANKVDDVRITAKTRTKQNNKIDFAKEAYKKNVINSDNPPQTEEIIIKYKSE